MPRRTGGAGFPGAPSDAPDGAPAALRSSVAGSGHGRVPGGVTERGEDTGSEDSTPRKGAPSVLRALPPLRRPRPRAERGRGCGGPRTRGMSTEIGRGTSACARDPSSRTGVHDDDRIPRPTCTKRHWCDVRDRGDTRSPPKAVRLVLSVRRTSPMAGRVRGLARVYWTPVVPSPQRRDEIAPESENVNKITEELCRNATVRAPSEFIG